MSSIRFTRCICDPGIEVLPGPGAYSAHDVRTGVLSTERQGSKITMGMKTKSPFKKEAPPPNTYYLRSGVGSRGVHENRPPQWSMGARRDVGSVQYAPIKANIPGAGTYAATDPAVVKPVRGRYTIQGRTKIKEYNTIFGNPGPGAYDPKLPCTAGKGTSLGIRHSPYTVPCITALDVY